MSKPALEMRNDILQTITKEELVEIDRILEDFKNDFLKDKWYDTGVPVDCQNLGYNIRHLSARQRLYLVNLGYRVVSIWDGRICDVVITLHLY